MQRIDWATGAGLPPKREPGPRTHVVWDGNLGADGVQEYYEARAWVQESLRFDDKDVYVSVFEVPELFVSKLHFCHTDRMQTRLSCGAYQLFFNQPRNARAFMQAETLDAHARRVRSPFRFLSLLLVEGGVVGDACFAADTATEGGGGVGRWSRSRFESSEACSPPLT